jgi:hypothetical protein
MKRKVMNKDVTTVTYCKQDSDHCDKSSIQLKVHQLVVRSTYKVLWIVVWIKTNPDLPPCYDLSLS